MLFASTIAAADTFNFVYYYPPGGGTDTWAAPVVQELERRGHTVNREYLKGCHAAVNHALTKKNAFLVSALDISPQTSQDVKTCPSLQEQPGIKYFTNIATAPLFLCTSPKNSQLSLQNFVNGIDNWRVGYAVTWHATAALKTLTNTGTPKPNVKFIPYLDQSAMRAVAIAGTDLDFLIIGNNHELIEKSGGKCIASTSRQNHKKLPFLGDVYKSSMTEMHAPIYFWSVGTVDGVTTKLFTEVFQSQIFKDYLAARPAHLHVGLGTGVTIEQGYQTYIKSMP